MSGYCTQCGEPRRGARFCPACGVEHPQAASAGPKPPAAATTAPVASPRRTLRCVECAAPIDAGLVCARCASQAAPIQPEANAVLVPSPEDVPSVARPTSSPQAYGGERPAAWQSHWLARTAFAVVAVLVTFLWIDGKTHGRFGRDASEAGTRLSHSLANGGLDGVYVCADGPMPTSMTIRIEGSSGSIDVGAFSVEGMRLERHGDTVSMWGGRAHDADGRPVDEETQRAISDGGGAELLTVGDDGQSLSLQLSGGKTAKFVKRP